MQSLLRSGVPVCQCAGMPAPLSKNIRKRLRDLHAMSSSSNEHEADNARQRLEELMAKHGLTWEGLDAILKDEDKPEHFNVLNLVDGQISRFIWITPEQRLFV